MIHSSNLYLKFQGGFVIYVFVMYNTLFISCVCVCLMSCPSVCMCVCMFVYFLESWLVNGLICKISGKEKFLSFLISYLFPFIRLPVSLHPVTCFPFLTSQRDFFTIINILSFLPSFLPSFMPCDSCSYQVCCCLFFLYVPLCSSSSSSTSFFSSYYLF